MITTDKRPVCERTEEERNQLVRDHERLIHGICRHYLSQLRQTIEYEDMYASALYRFAILLNKWEPERAELTTFCTQDIHRYLWLWLRVARRGGLTQIGDTKFRTGGVNDKPPKTVSGNAKNDSDGGELFDTIANREAEERTTWPKEVWDKVLSCLPTDRHRKIIVKRFIHGISLIGVANEIGVSKERVRQVEAQAIQRLRENLESLRLEEEL